MKETLSVVLWLVLTVAAFTTAVFAAQALFSKDNEKEYVWTGLYKKRNHNLGSLIYFVFVITGWLAIVAVGVYGLLAWLPHSADELRGVLASFTAFISLYILEHLDRAAFMRQELAVRNAALAWIDNQLRYCSRLSDDEIERLEEESRDQKKPHTKHLIALWARDLAKALKERDERTEAQVIQRLRREREE